MSDQSDKKTLNNSLSAEALAQAIADIYCTDEAIDNAKTNKNVEKQKTPPRIENKPDSPLPDIDDSTFSLDDLPDHDGIMDCYKPKNDEFNKKSVPVKPIVRKFHSVPSFGGCFFPFGGIGNVLKSNVSKESDESSIPMVKFTKIAAHGFVCMASSHYFDNKREQGKFDRTDGIILPKDMGERFMSSSMKLYSVRVKSDTTDLEVFGRVVGFDAPEHTAVLPMWMMNDMMLATGDRINVTSVDLPKITKLKFKGNAYVENITAVLEYILRDHAISYNSKVIKVKVFDKEFTFEVEKQEPTYAGVIIGGDIDLEQ